MPSLASCLDKQILNKSTFALSNSELDALKLLTIGKSSKEISAILGISKATVETYRFRVARKIDASTLVDLVHYAIRIEIVKLAHNLLFFAHANISASFESKGETGTIALAKMCAT